MRAYLLNRYGDASCAALGETKLPQPGPNDVQIKVVAAGLNPVDFKIREGKLKALFAFAFPCILGNELSGEVLNCGSAVKKFHPGDRVFTRVAKEKLGAFAEFACVDQSFVAHAPKSIELANAAAIPLAGLTALQALRDELQVKPGMHILITGGAGGVGSFAIPLAKHFGATVTTTASSRGAALVEKLGADFVLDYSKSDLAKGERDFDLAFDLVGGDTLNACFARVKKNARVLSIAGVPEPRTAKIDLQRGVFLRTAFWFLSFSTRHLARKNNVDYRYLFMHPSGEDLRFLANLVDAKKLQVCIDQFYDFEKIGEALAYLETGRAKGKIVVRFN